MWSGPVAGDMMRRALASSRTRRLILAALAAALIVLLVFAPGALGDAITPESGGGSQNAESIDTLYKIALYIAIVIFLLVESVLLWSIFRYRARRGGPEPAQIRGNTPLELGWTIAAAGILVVLATVTFIYLARIEDPPASDPGGLQSVASESAELGQPPVPGGKSLTIQVNGQQYIWRFVYPGQPQLFSYHTMVVPTGTTIVLKITSSDVNHSWWVPKLGGKADAVPGHVNSTWFKIKRGQEGVYGGQCAELCGYNHADMRNAVRAVTPAQFIAWEKRQRADIKASQVALEKQRKERLRTGGIQ
jgi:cytochrome c oxidase subunit II